MNKLTFLRAAQATAENIVNTTIDATAAGKPVPNARSIAQTIADDFDDLKIDGQHFTEFEALSRQALLTFTNIVKLDLNGQPITTPPPAPAAAPKPAGTPAATTK